MKPLTPTSKPPIIIEMSPTSSSSSFSCSPSSRDGTPRNDTSRNDTHSTKKDLQDLMMFGSVFVLFIWSTYIFKVLWSKGPILSEEEKVILRGCLPSKLSDMNKIKDVTNIKSLFELFQKYQQTHSTFLLGFMSYCYLYFQAFPLFLWWCPGTGTAISLLLCSFYGFWRGLVGCLILASSGPAIAFTIARWTAQPVIDRCFRRYFAEKLNKLESVLHDQRDHLLYAIVFLRMTPVVPNFLINLASPCLGVPFHTFFFGTCIGLIPNTIMLVLMGTTLKELTSLNQGFGPILLICLLSFIVLIPSIKQRYLPSFSDDPSPHDEQRDRLKESPTELTERREEK
eukprot:Selendium_serpulae@DN2363_c0_g1_i1.p1